MNAPRGNRVVPALLTLLALVACAPLSAQAPGEALSARAFEVHYRPLTDAADLVTPVLSEDGVLTLRLRLKTLVVEDRVSVLDRVQSLLESYDLPPRNIEIVMSLFLGTDRRAERGASPVPAGGNEMSGEVRGVLEALGDFTKWTAYEPLGSRAVTGAEGDQVVAKLSDDYRVLFTVESIHEGRGVVKFRVFALQRVTLDDAGVESVEDLYKTGMVLSAGKLHVVGAATDPDSNRALFLTVQARPR